MFWKLRILYPLCWQVCEEEREEREGGEGQEYDNVYKKSLGVINDYEQLFI